MLNGTQIFVILAALFASLSNYCIGREAAIPPVEISVLGERLDYGLANSPAPTLIYEKVYFQSFEPQAVGDMLKRVSGVSFTSDIGEFSAPQLRGLGAQYTQILINGERIPGSSGDRSALVDHIPAELIERIEIIRSPTPDLDSQGIGGTINLILKDGAGLQGNEWRLGGLYYSDLDPTFKGTAAITHGVTNDPWSYLISANVQQRLGPKSKTEHVFDDEANLIRVVSAEDFRDSTDTSLSGSLAVKLGIQGDLSVRIAYLRSRIDEEESIEVFDQAMELDNTGFERRRTDQDRLEFGMQFNRMLVRDMNFQLNFSASQFDDNSSELEGILEQGFELVELRQITSTEDLELLMAGSLSWKFQADHAIEIGLGASREDRDSNQILFEIDDDELVDETPGNGLYRVQETRIHAYIKDRWTLSSNATLEYGLRAEDTSLHQRGNDGRAKESQFELNPSAHLFYQLRDFGQFRASIARTLRRPSFDEIIPFTNQDTPNEDQVTIGNPKLQPEFAWGIDLGYAHRFENNAGILGLNLFYREIDNKIELTQIGDDLFTPDNIGRGQTWGLELDFNTTLSLLGLPQVGVYTNYTWLDSKIRDPFTRQNRRFNLQPDFIGNIDVIHNVPSMGLSHGFSLQKQGGVSELQADETKTVSYGANLEYFIEKRLGDDVMLRLSVNNLLDASKREHGVIYQSLADLQNGTVEEVVFEKEQSEPVFLVTIRGTF